MRAANGNDARRGRAAAGFTLVELIVSLAVTSLLLGALTSTMILAAHAWPGRGGTEDPIVHGSEAADWLISELQEAVFFMERRGNVASFTVADRDGDGQHERICWAWSGVPGDPLIRAYNGGPSVPVLENVHAFSLGYTLQPVTETYVGPLVMGAEQVVSAYTTLSSVKQWQVEAKKFIGQYAPLEAASWPTGTVAWHPSRVRIYGKRSGPPVESFLVQLCSADASHLPSAPTVFQQTFNEASLPTNNDWVNLTLNDAPALAVGQALDLVLAHPGTGGSAASVGYRDAGQRRLTTTDGGANWNYDGDKALIHEFYGRPLSPGPPRTTTRNYVTSVGVTLQVGEEAAEQVSGAARTLNRPENLGYLWDTDFIECPACADINGDAIGDWAYVDGQTFTGVAMSGGVWHADAALRTMPDCDFTGTTTLQTTFCDTGTGGNPVAVQINADFSRTACVMFRIELNLETNGTQTLSLVQVNAAGQRRVLRAVPGYAPGFVTTRLLIEPQADVVHLQVNDVELGTWTYTCDGALASPHAVLLLPGASTGDFADASVRVAGQREYDLIPVGRAAPRARDGDASPLAAEDAGPPVRPDAENV